MRRVTTGASGAVCFVATLCVLAVTAFAQSQPQPGTKDPGHAARLARESMMLVAPGGNEAPRFTRPSPPLTSAQSERLRRAYDLRLQGLTDRSRDTLNALLREVPHHPLFVTELARTLAVRGDWAAIVTLGRDERLRNRDSLLVTRELSTALERQARPREAAQVVLESWAASEREGTWAPGRLL